VVPAYGDSPYLRECLLSLKAQTLTCTIVISTSTSSDYICKIASEFNIPLRINDNGGTISKDWNFALRCAEADNIVVLAHQDDIYDREYASKCTKFFSNYPDCSIVFTNCYEMIDDRLTRTNMRELVKRALRNIAFLNHEIIHTPAAIKRLLGFGCPIPCPSVAFNLSKMPDFCFSSEYSINLDWDAWFQIGFSGGKIGFIRSPLLTHRLHDSSETNKGLIDQRRQKEDLKIFERLWSPIVARTIQIIYSINY
jgi:hypothetical protein